MTRDCAHAPSDVRSAGVTILAVSTRFSTIHGVVALFLMILPGCGDREGPSDLPPGVAQLIADVAPGPSNSSPGYMSTQGDRAYFSTGGLWATDGLDVSMVHPKVDPSGMGQAGTTVYFPGFDPAHGYELWSTDGTAAGTRLVKDINPGPEYNFGGNSYPRGFTGVGRVMFFTACDPENGFGVWRSDGTESGTRLVKDINPRPLRRDATHDGCLDDSEVRPIDFVELGGALYFLADDGVHDWELWRSDGTTEGTHMLIEVVPEPYRRACTVGACTPPQVAELRKLGGSMLLFRGGTSLWRSDGTAAGTLPVAAVYPGFLTAGETLAYFLGPNGEQYSLWRSDGTPGGTFPVGSPQIPTSVRFNNRVSGFAVAGDRLFFNAVDKQGYELWTSDGVTTGIVLDIAPGEASSWPASFTPFRDRLYLTAEDGKSRQVWVTDGTADGTRPVTSLTRGVAPSEAYDPSFPRDDMAVVGGRLVFPGRDDEHGTEPWAVRVD
jgi:ELWxxDGT repeat protein